MGPLNYPVMQVYSPYCYIGYTGTISLPFSSVRNFVKKILTPRTDTRITYLVYTPGLPLPGSSFTHFQPGSTYEITSSLPPFASYTIPVCGSLFDFPRVMDLFSGTNNRIGYNYITISPFAGAFPLSTFNSYINLIYAVNPIGNNSYLVYRPGSLRPAFTHFEPGSSYNVQIKGTIKLLPTPTPTQSPTPSITPSNTPTPSITPSNTPTPSITPSITPSNTRTPTPTPSNTRTPTPTKTPTPTRTPTSTTISLPATVCVTGAGESVFNTFYSRNASLSNGRYYTGFPYLNPSFIPYLLFTEIIYLGGLTAQAGWILTDDGGNIFYYNVTSNNYTVPLQGWQSAPFGQPPVPVLNVGPCATPTPSPTITSTPTQTPTRTSTPTPTRTPVLPPTPPPTQTPTQSRTPAQTSTPTQTPSRTPVPLPVEPPDGFAVLSYIYFNSMQEMQVVSVKNTVNYGNGIVMTDLGNGTYRSLNVWAENNKSILNSPQEIFNYNGSHKGLRTTHIAYGGKNCNSFYSAISSFTVYFNRYTGSLAQNSVKPAHGYFNIVFDSAGNPVINLNSSRFTFPERYSGYGDGNGNTIIHQPGGSLMRSCADQSFNGYERYMAVSKYDVANCDLPSSNYNLYGADTYMFVNDVNSYDKMGCYYGWFQKQAFIGVLPTLGNYSTYGTTNNLFLISPQASTNGYDFGRAIRIMIYEITGGSGWPSSYEWKPVIRYKAMYQSGDGQFNWLDNLGQGIFSTRDPYFTRAVQPCLTFTGLERGYGSLQPMPVEGSLACLPDRYDYYFSSSIQCGGRPKAGYNGQQAGTADKDKIVTYNIKSYDNVAALPEVDVLPWPNPRIPEVQCHKNVSSCINPVNGFPIIAFREVGAPIGRGHWNSTPDGLRLMYYNGTRWLNWNGATTYSRFWTRTATDRVVPTQYPGYIKVLCNKTGTKIWTYFILNSFVGYNPSPNNPNFGPGGKYDATYTNAQHLNSGIYKMTFTGSVAAGYSPGSIETVVAPVGNRVITQLEAKNQFLR